MREMLTISVLVFTILFNIQTSTTHATERGPEQEGTKVALQDTGTKNTQSNSKITLKQILNKYYQAIGGRKAWETLDSYKFAGSMYTKEATFKTAAVFMRPDLCRLDFQAGNLYFMEAYDGNLAWQMNPGMGNGPQILKGKRAKEMMDTCDFEGPLVNHKQKGHEIKYMGKEEIEDRWAYVLEVKTKHGNTDNYYLDSETFLPFMVKGKTTIQDQVVPTTINISEYMEIGNIKIAFSYEFLVEGNLSPEVLKIKTFQLNDDINENIFNLPKRPQDMR